jgi:hypothetical protein
LNFNEICLMDDIEAILQKITTTKCIGRWTAVNKSWITQSTDEVYSSK